MLQKVGAKLDEDAKGPMGGDSVAVRLSDVASRAGVSVKTVSNVVSGYVHVSATTRQRVQKALDELGYRPNLSARSLRGGRSGVIALAVPALQPYFAEVASLVGSAAEKAGYTLLVEETQGLSEREARVIKGIRSQLVDGVIFSPIALDGSAIACYRDTTPLVLLGGGVPGGSVDHVAIDDIAAARDAVEHVVTAGRRRVAAVGALREASGDPAHLRLKGYRAVLAAAGLAAPREMVLRVPRSSRIEGWKATRRLLASSTHLPDAIFAFNDMLALGVLRALHEAGVRVPDDIAVMGFDDVEDGRFCVPSLTTVSPDKGQIARYAVEYLLSRRNGSSDSEPREAVVAHRLVSRESTVGCSHAR